MKKIIRLTESDLARIVKRVLMEQDVPTQGPTLPEPIATCMGKFAETVSGIPGCMAVVTTMMSGKQPTPKDIGDCVSGIGTNGWTIASKMMECISNQSE